MAVGGLLQEQELNEGLLSIWQSQNPHEIPAIARLASKIVDRLTELFKPKEQSTSDRQAVESGEIEIEGVKYRSNRDFTETSLLLALKLGINELTAAKLLLEASPEAKRTSKSPFECSTELFFIRNQFLLECCRIFLILSKDTNVEPEFRSKFNDALHSHFVEKSGISTQAILRLLYRLQKQIVDTEEEIRQERILSETDGSNLLENCKLRWAAFYEEFESASTLLALFAKFGCCSTEDLTSIITFTQKSSKSSIFSLSLIPVCAYLVSRMLSDLPARRKDLKKYDERSLWDDISNLQKTQIRVEDKAEWNDPLLHEILCFICSLKIAGIVREEVSDHGMLERIGLESKEIVIRSMTDGLFRKLISACCKWLGGQTLEQMWYQYFLTVDDDSQNQLDILENSCVMINETMRYEILEVLNTICIDLISFFPDALREVKLFEEDVILSNQSTLGNAGQLKSVEPAIESFLYILCLIHKNLPTEFAQNWWDTESDEYGFLLWARTFTAPSMICSFCIFLSTIIEKSSDSSMPVEFLKSIKEKGGPDVSFKFIFTSLQYYVNSFSGNYEPQSNHERSLNDPAVQPEIDTESSLVLQSYLNIIHSLLTSNPENFKTINENSNERIIELLFDFLRCPISEEPISVTFEVLASISNDINSAERDIIWRFFVNWNVEASRRWFMTSNIGLLDGTSRATSPEKRLAANLISLLRDRKCTSSLLRMITSLYETQLTRFPFPQEIEKFSKKSAADIVALSITKELFEEIASFNRTLEMTIIRLYLRAIRSLLYSFNYSQINQVISVFADTQDALTESCRNYARNHPALVCIKELKNTKCFSTLMRILCMLADQSDGDDGSKVFILEILVFLLEIDKFMDEKLQQGHSDSEKDEFARDHATSMLLTFNPEVIGKIFLLMSDESLVVRKAAITVMSKVIMTPQFKPKKVSERQQNRLISTLANNEDCNTALLRLMMRIESDYNVRATQDIDDEFTYCLINLFIKDLEENTNQICFTLFVLGFNLSNFYENSQNISACQIWNDSNILSSLIDYQKENVNGQNIKFKEKLARFLYLLLSSSISCTQTVEFLISKGNLLERWLQEETELYDALSDVLIQRIRIRTSLTKIYAIVLNETAAQSQISRLQYYLQNLTFMATFDDEENFIASGMRILDFFDILRIHIPDFNALIDENVLAFESFLEDMKGVPQYNLQKIELGFHYWGQENLQQTSKEIVPSHKDGDGIISTLSKWNDSVMLASTCYNCMSALYLLLGVIFDVCKGIMPQAGQEYIFIDTCKYLSPFLETFTPGQSEMAKYVSLILESAFRDSIGNQKPNPSFDKILLDVVRRLIGGVCHQNSQYAIRENLYRTILFICRKHEKNLLTDEQWSKIEPVILGANLPEKFINVAANDVIKATSMCKLQSCSVMKYIFEWNRAQQNHSIFALCKKHNFVPALASNCLKYIDDNPDISAGNSEMRDFELELSMDLLDEIAKTADGAREIFSSGLFVGYRHLCKRETVPFLTVYRERIFAKYLLRIAIRCILELEPQSSRISSSLTKLENGKTPDYDDSLVSLSRICESILRCSVNALEKSRAKEERASTVGADYAYSFSELDQLVLKFKQAISVKFPSSNTS